LAVSDRGLFGVFDTTGKEILPMIYKDITALKKAYYALDRPSVVERILQFRNSIGGFSFMEGTDQMLTYDSEWITFWDLKSNTEIGHFTLNNTPHGDAMGYQTIKHAGYLDPLNIYAEFYISGGGGHYYRVLNTFDQGASIPHNMSTIEFQLPIPGSGGKAVLGKDEGTRVDLYRYDPIDHSFKLWHKGEEGKDVHTYRVNTTPNHNSTHFGYYDQISKKYWVHSFSNPSLNYFLSREKYPEGSFVFSEKNLLLLQEGKFQKFNLTTGAYIGTVDAPGLNCSGATCIVGNKLFFGRSDTIYQFDLIKGRIEKAVKFFDTPDDRTFSISQMELHKGKLFVACYGDLIVLDTANLQIVQDFNARRFLIQSDNYYRQNSFNESTLRFYDHKNHYQLDLKSLELVRIDPALKYYSADSSLRIELDRKEAKDFRLYQGKNKKIVPLTTAPKKYFSEDPLRAAIAPDAKTIVVIFRDRVHLFDRNTLKEKVIWIEDELKYPMNDNWLDPIIEFSPTGNKLLLSANSNRPYYDAALLFLDLRSGKIEHLLKNKNAKSRGQAEWLALSNDSTLKVYEKEIVYKKYSESPESYAEERLLCYECADYSIFKNFDERMYTYGKGMEYRRNDSLIATFYLFQDLTYFVVLPNNYYFTNSLDLSQMIFRVNGRSYPFEQFDLRYHRPDIVLKQLGYASPKLIEAYHQAYKKRLAKLGLEEQMLQDDFHLPEIRIDGFERLPVITSDTSIGLNLQLRDEKYEIDRIRVWVNDVAVYGQAGIPVHKKGTVQQKISVPLTAGKNKIQIAVLNAAGVESLKETFVLQSNAAVKKPDLYMIAIGAGDFEQTQFNLRYPAKDAADMVQLFSESKKYGQVFSKTLTGKEVTKTSILQLKQFLLQANVQDEVIVFFAGHGVLDAQLDYSLPTYELNFLSPTQKGLAYSDLEGLLDGIRPQKKLLILDACHSGEIDKSGAELSNETILYEKNEDLAFRNVGTATVKLGASASTELMRSLFLDLRKGTGATVISSAGGAELSMEGSAWKNGLFTYCLLEGIRSAKADLNKDGQIQLSELQSYLALRVAALSNSMQQPTSRIVNKEVDFVVW